MNWSDYLNPFAALGNAAASVVADGWTAAMLGIWNAGLWLLKLALTVEDAFLVPDLSASGPMRDLYGATFWIAGAMVLVLFLVQLGISKDPEAHPAWRGGKVSGFISHGPDHRPLIALALGKGTTPPLMLVADTPPPELAPNAGPDLSAIPNNHFAYAVQWFLFALVALVIYILALRKRWRTG